jgi:hypothetical protein
MTSALNFNPIYCKNAIVDPIGDIVVKYFLSQGPVPEYYPPANWYFYHLAACKDRGALFIT